MGFARSFMRRGLVALFLIAILLPLTIVSAQAPVEIDILPANTANFLPGAMFDFRIEIHADAVPADLKVTVNGTDASAMFGSEPAADSWMVGPEGSQMPVQAWTWRNLTAPAPGDYVVEVTTGGSTTTATWTVRQPSTTRVAKNVILFIGDGMTVPEITAARIASLGLTAGRLNGEFNMDTADAVGLAHTNSLDSMMMDSANTASSINTGHLGDVESTGIYGDSSPDALDDPRVETLGSMVHRVYGMSVGVVTTADASDATPAAVWAHGRDRSNGSRNEYLVQALDSGYIDVLMGGGARRMIPQSTEGSRRGDDRNLFDEYTAVGFTVVTTAAELNDAMASSTPAKLLGIFNPNDMNVWLDRNVYTDNLGDFTDQPGLTQMTLAALQVLSQNQNGFYLEVEGASIDKQMHPLDEERALSDLIELDQALGATIAWAKENAPDTLIVVTADHGHGYDVYGTVDVAQFNAATDDAGRREAIKTYGDAGFPDYVDANGDGVPEWGDATHTFAGNVNNGPDRTEDFQVSPVPRVPAIQNDAKQWVDNPDDDPNGILITGDLPMSNGSTGVHTLQDVPVFAFGPGAQEFSGVYHQSEIFFDMADALGLDPSKAQ